MLSPRLRAIAALLLHNDWFQSLASLSVIYVGLIIAWLRFYGHHWAPAFPKARTMFAISLVALPVWSLCMVWRQWRRVRSLGNGQQRHGSAQDERSVARHSKWDRLLLYTFTVLSVGGTLVVGTFHDTHEARNRALLVASSGAGRNARNFNEPVYIAAIFHNNDKVLPHWTQEMLRLVQYIGTDNVFLSLVESYSTDNTPELLKSFGATLTQMRVPHRIIINDTSILRPPKIVSNVARVDFLAATRNLALEPLRSRRSFARGRVLFSNDVYVTAEAMVELLNTRDGDYDIACGMDFDDFGLYDVWVTRDRVGGMVAGVWPFLLEPSGRRSIERNEPAQVFTCWNGIIALRAEPFLPPALRLDNSSSKLSEKPLHPALPSSHPGYQNGRTAPPRNAPALQFRASGWEECFSSESFLLGYDMRRQFALMQVYLNPRVVTAYHRRFFFWNNYVLRHWLVRWWMRNVEGGRNLHRARIVLSKVGARGVTLWDGGACQGTWET